MQTLRQDLRYGLRLLAKSPGFTLVSVLTLALGIGANTALFSAVNGLVLRPAPYADASRLVSIIGFRRFSGGMVGEMTFSAAVWKAVQSQTPAIERMAVYGNQQNFTLTGQAIPDIAPGVRVSGDLFPLLGVRPLLGRPILSADTRPGARPVVVLSYALWHSDFGADPAVIGRVTMLDGKAFTIVGVMPEGFRFPLDSGSKGIWLPFVVSVAQKENEQIAGVAAARLRPGVSIDGLNAQLKTVSARLSGHFKAFFKGGYFLAQTIKPRFGDLDSALLVLLGAVGFVLLIACVNVSSLLLARGWARQREIAIREALGATRTRIIRQLLTESMLLALLGGGLGLLFSVWGVHILRAITPLDSPEHGHFQLDQNVLWFTLAISLFAAVLSGLVPALQISARKVDGRPEQNLRGSRGAISTPRIRRLQHALTAVEMALALILVVGATLAALSLENLVSLNLGFRTDHILAMTAHFSKTICDPEKNDAACQLAVATALDKMRVAPGVESAAVASTLPLAEWEISPAVRIQGRAQEISLGGGAIIEKRAISPGYFHTLGIPLLSGREFSEDDTADSGAVAIVDETFARKYLGGHPLGRRISEENDKSGNPEWIDVVGVVGNARDFISPKKIPAPEIYSPFAQAVTFTGTTYIVRTAADPMAVAPAIKRAIWAADKNAPITDLETMDQQVRAVTATPQFQAILLGAFAGLGLLMAVIGVYGVIAYAVATRTHEIGVRMALGAQRGDVLRMVIGEGATLAGIGIAIGIGGALALTRFLRSLLFEIKPTDPSTFVGVAAAFLLVALAACYIPARRAMRVDPVVALRQE